MKNKFFYGAVLFFVVFVFALFFSGAVRAAVMLNASSMNNVASGNMHNMAPMASDMTAEMGGDMMSNMGELA
jgi:hypothetical protein